MSWEYILKTEKQLKDWYDDKVKRRICGFTDFDDFNNWYSENIKDGVCSYCGLTERESQRIVHEGILTSKRFPLSGEFSQGVNRGFWLEVDRKEPNGLYSRRNCVPSCYFCNNDKSDVFTELQYREFRVDRIGFLRRLLNDVNE